MIKGQTVLTVEAKDLSVAHEDSRALLDKARSALARAAWADWLVNTCSSFESKDQP